jgi:trans-aconitate methyltransferase
MSYLDSEESSVLYKTPANIIKQHNLKNIVDVGCRTGEINRYLNDYSYSYYGIDTSEEPIEAAKQRYPSQTFEVRSWDDLKSYPCDVVVFGSVLIYADDPIEMFERVCKFYNPKRAIVHEVNKNNIEDLKYTDLTYFNKYDCKIYNFDLNIPVGKRTIIDVQYR